MSLAQNIPNFWLWILCLDEQVYRILVKLDLPHTTLVKLKELERADPDLLRVKKTRTQEEYYWTMSPCWPRYVLKKHPRLDHISYIDADLYFYAHPESIFRELGKNSILIVPHRFPDYFKWKEGVDGIFNVSMVVFRRDTNSRVCLNWWRHKCLEWCYRKPDKGRLGDQMYLNVWPQKFAGVHILQHKGGGLAPWNLMNHPITSQNGRLMVGDEPVVFYHFHGLRILKGNRFDNAPFYEINRQTDRLIYRPYQLALLGAMQRVEDRFGVNDYGAVLSRSLLSRGQENVYVAKLKMVNWLNRWKVTRPYVRFVIGGSHE